MGGAGAAVGGTGVRVAGDLVAVGGNIDVAVTAKVAVAVGVLVEVSPDKSTGTLCTAITTTKINTSKISAPKMPTNQINRDDEPVVSCRMPPGLGGAAAGGRNGWDGVWANCLKRGETTVS